MNGGIGAGGELLMAHGYALRRGQQWLVAGECMVEPLMNYCSG